MTLFFYLNFGVLLLILGSRTAFSSDDLLKTNETAINLRREKFHSYLENLINILGDIKKLTLEAAINLGCNKLEKIMVSNMEVIKVGIESLQFSFKEFETSIDTLFYDGDLLRTNQNALDLKLEKVLQYVEYIKKVSGDIKKNTLETAFNSERHNATEYLSVLALQEISSQVGIIKKFLDRTGDLSKLQEESELDKTEEEKSCHEVPKSILSIVNDLFNMDTSQYEDVLKNYNECWKDLPKGMEGHTYFLTPKLKQQEALKYCFEQDGKPFIPQNREEFIYYVAMTVEPETEMYSWYPINDIEEEGHLVLEDGTDYGNASYKLPLWEEKWENSKDADCATVDIGGKGSWSRCYHNDFVFLCQGNLIKK